MDGYEFGGRRFDPVPRSIHHYNTILSCFAKQRDFNNLRLYFEQLKTAGTTTKVVQEASAALTPEQQSGETVMLRPNMVKNFLFIIICLHAFVSHVVMIQITFVALFTGFANSSASIDAYWREMVDYGIRPDARYVPHKVLLRTDFPFINYQLLIAAQLYLSFTFKLFPCNYCNEL